MAAFPQANQGDVSPNTAGPRCIDTGEACDVETSTCNGKVCTTIYGYIAGLFLVYIHRSKIALRLVLV